LLLLSNQNKKNKEKDKGIFCVMCITNDDATINGSKCIDEKKKMLEKGEEKQKRNETMKKL
jgi:hypothetical protein